MMSSQLQGDFSKRFVCGILNRITQMDIQEHTHKHWVNPFFWKVT